MATAIRVNGAPITWRRAGSGYLLMSTDVLSTGNYTLSIGTQSLDLAGLGLAESFQRSFTLSAGETRKQIYLRSLPGFSSTSTIGNLFGFHGQPLDPETGLLYIRNRYYDPELGRFITTDPMGYGDGPNLYQYGLNNPANFSDPTGEYVESAWDMVSLGFGLASLANNIKEENYGGALLDIFGIAVDGIALAVPLVPGGAGAALRASRAAGFLGKLEFIDTGINMAQGAIQARDSFREGNYGWGTFYAGMSALGLKGGLESPFKVQIHGVGANLGNVRIVSNSAATSSASVSKRTRELSGVASRARWVKSQQGVEGPGLRDHFEKHGWQVEAKTAREYDLSARITIQRGRRFRYKHKGASRVGYWDPGTGLFTTTSESRRIPTIMSHYALPWEDVKRLNGFTVIR